jgi:hypothetical protein
MGLCATTIGLAGGGRLSTRGAGLIGNRGRNSCTIPGFPDGFCRKPQRQPQKNPFDAVTHRKSDPSRFQYLPSGEELSPISIFFKKIKIAVLLGYLPFIPSKDRFAADTPAPNKGFPNANGE